MPHNGIEHPSQVDHLARGTWDPVLSAEGGPRLDLMYDQWCHEQNTNASEADDLYGSADPEDYKGKGKAKEK